METTSAEHPLRMAIEDPGSPPVTELLRRHLAEMYAISPAGSVYAFDVGGLRVPEVTLRSSMSAELLKSNSI